MIFHERDCQSITEAWFDLLLLATIKTDPVEFSSIEILEKSVDLNAQIKHSKNPSLIEIKIHNAGTFDYVVSGEIRKVSVTTKPFQYVSLNASNSSAALRNLKSILNLFTKFAEDQEFKTWHSQG